MNVRLVGLAVLVAACGGPPAAPSAAPQPVAASATSEPVAATAPTPSSEPAPAPPEVPAQPQVRFLAVGDMLLSRGVAKAIVAADDPFLPYRGMKERFAEVDFTFANLEFPFSKETLVPVRGNIFNAPQAWVKGLVQHKFRVLNLANNHAMDQGERGLFDTIALLKEHDLVGFGAGKNEREAWAPGIIEVNGIRIGFVGASYASVNDSGKTWLRFVARIEDKHRLKATIERLKEETDFVVATMHAGIEYVPVPFGPQQLFADAALKFGADIVIGAHPHVVQPAFQRDGRWAFHSLGNFIFDQSDPHTDEGAALDIVLRRHEDGAVRMTRLEVLPVVIENGTPRLADEARSQAILERMKLERGVLVETEAAP
jgi:poly-gamma-glutamate capsule biosynthesis protein CapA/YwtB (metallophosphatase superfamily)